MSPAPGHPYVDNACAHGVHADCPGFCRYCLTPCACGCPHPGGGDPAPVPATVCDPTPPRGQRFARTEPTAEPQEATA